MKINAICVDKSGTKAEVTVDFDYVSDADALRHWIDEELMNGAWSTRRALTQATLLS